MESGKNNGVGGGQERADLKAARKMVVPFALNINSVHMMMNGTLSGGLPSS